MKKSIVILLVMGVVLMIGLFLVKAGKPKGSSQPSFSQNSPTTAPSVSVDPADRVEVVHFHASKQCWSCITVGEYALKTVKEKFPDEYAGGKIVFMDVNAELKENQEIVTKFQARGSSLFINAIRNDQDDIVEDVTVWRLVNNETQFVRYFENELKSLLGK